MTGFTAFAANVQYSYDAQNRLLAEETLPYGKKLIYQYDDVGNTVTKTVTETFLNTTSVTGNGAITSDFVRVDRGGSQTFTITPDTGYWIANVLVDGISVGAVSSYTFTNVMANHTITASFASNTQDNGIRLTGSITAYFSTLQAAYNTAANGDIIQMKVTTINQALNFNRDINVTFTGGYNSDYSSITGLTTLQGGTWTGPSSGTVTLKECLLATN